MSHGGLGRLRRRGTIGAVEHVFGDALDQVTAGADARKPLVAKPHLVAALDPVHRIQKPDRIDLSLEECHAGRERPPCPVWPDAGELVDERHLYRIELAAQDREQGPFWITTVGLARVARPGLW